MYDEELETESPGTGRSLGRTLWNLLLLLVFLALAFGLLYLVAERNARQYFLTAAEGELVVKRGVFFPVGDTPYLPDDERLRLAYAPVPIPAGEEVPDQTSFQERSDLDRRLLELLLEWAQERIPSDDRDRLERGMYYVERAHLIPTASAEQRAALARLEARVAWYDALRLLAQANEALEAAGAKLGQAQASGDETSRRSAALQARIEALSTELSRLLPQRPATSGDAAADARPEGESELEAAPGDLEPAPLRPTPAVEPGAESGAEEPDTGQGRVTPETRSAPERRTAPEQRAEPAAPRAAPAPTAPAPQPAPRAVPAPRPAPEAPARRAPTDVDPSGRSAPAPGTSPSEPPAAGGD